MPAVIKRRIVFAEVKAPRFARIPAGHGLDTACAQGRAAFFRHIRVSRLAAG